MSPALITYPTWKEMFGGRPSYDELLNEIRQFDKTHTAWFISRLNMLLALGRFHSQEIIPIQKLMLGLLIDEELLDKLKKTFGTERIEERTDFRRDSSEDAMLAEYPGSVQGSNRNRAG